MSFERGQPPAWQTKVVDGDLCSLKSGQACLSVPACANDTSSSKSTLVGRDAVDVLTQAICGCVVGACGSVRCKTCKHISQGSTFTSNVTKRSYDVISHSASINCTSNKCGVFNNM